MLNIVLGSTVEGEITAGSVDVNGTWYPSSLMFSKSTTSCDYVNYETDHC